MVSLGNVARREQTKTRTVKVTNPDGERFELSVTYWPNKLTMEPIELTDDESDSEDDDVARTSLRNAKSFCAMVSGWDLTGPWLMNDGTTIGNEVEPLPLEPIYVRSYPTWLTSQITSEIMDIEFPNRNGGRAGRKRS